MKKEVCMDSSLNTFWSRITLVCGNHGKDYSHEFVIKEVNRLEFYEKRRKNALRSEAFYTCPLYKNYEQVEGGETVCSNNIPYGEIFKLASWIESGESECVYGENVFLTGRKYKTKNGVEFKVVEQTMVDGEPHYKIAVLNKRAISGKKKTLD